MKSMMGIAGIILMIVGIVTLAYQGVTYTEREKIIQIGNVEVSADTQKTMYFPPILGGLSLVAGIVLVVVSRRNINK